MATGKANNTIRKGMIGKTVALGSNTVWPGSKALITATVRREDGLFYVAHYVDVPAGFESGIGREIEFSDSSVVF